MERSVKPEAASSSLVTPAIYFISSLFHLDNGLFYFMTYFVRHQLHKDKTVEQSKLWQK